MKQSVPLTPLPLTLPENDDTAYQFVLGVRDREMIMIEELLRKNKQRFQHATRDGKPVTPRNCYEADPVVMADGHTIVLVECEPTSLIGFCGKPRIIDHHRKEDPGFELAPAHYWEGSSLGQTWMLLKKHHRLKKPCKAYLIAAARDHARFAAARGECPGVKPEEVSRVGRRWIANELGIERRCLEGEIRNMTRVIERAPVIQMHNQEVTDLRHVEVGSIYSLAHFSIYEALADMSCAAIVKTGNLASESNKIVLLGDLVASTVKYFKEVWGPGIGLTDIYGCEVRGHGGGYLPNSFALAA